MLYRRRYAPTLWEEMDKLQREMNRLFDSTMSNRMVKNRNFPAINVWTKSDEGQVVTAELPGMKIEDLDIKVIGDTLTISGSREEPDIGEKAQFHRRERGYGSFNRSIQLPFEIESEKVEASYEKGILKIWLPRAEADKPRKITVKTS